MSEANNQMANDLLKDYWTTVTTGLSTLITEHELAASRKHKANEAAWKQAAMDFDEKAKATYKKYSTEAVKLAERVEKGSLKGAAEVSARLHGTAAFFDKATKGYVQDHFTALNKAKVSNYLAMGRKAVAGMGVGGGLVADAINIGIKYQEGDTYGAMASGVGTATILLATVALGSIGLVPAVLLATGISVVVPEIAEFALSYFDPFGINEKTNEDFQSAQNFVQRIDPLALDLDGDGIETVSADAGVIFDFNGDGIKTGTGWLSGDDGFLVLDRNGNGSIDNGSELFGIDTVKADGSLASDGFDALRELDSNGDGLFDAKDEAFDQVRVWQDKNQDGISQPDELKTLTELGISALNLDSEASSTINNGNLISAVGTVEFADGSSGTDGNLDLASNPFYREFSDKLPVHPKAEALLPDMRGSGAVRDLLEATSQSRTLTSLLLQYRGLATREEQRALLAPILGAWAGSADYPSLVQRAQAAAGDNIIVEFQYSGANADMELLAKIGILEVFNGSDFFSVSRGEDGRFTLHAGANVSAPLSTIQTIDGQEKLIINLADLPLNATQTDFLNQAYDSLFNSVHQSLTLQTRLAPYLQGIDFQINDDGVTLDYSALQQQITQTAASDPVEAIIVSLELQTFLADETLTGELQAQRSTWLEGLNTQDQQRLQTQLSDGFNGISLKDLQADSAVDNGQAANPEPPSAPASSASEGGEPLDLEAKGSADAPNAPEAATKRQHFAAQSEPNLSETAGSTDAESPLDLSADLSAEAKWYEQAAQDLAASVQGSDNRFGSVKERYKTEQTASMSEASAQLESQLQSLIDEMASFNADASNAAEFIPMQREPLDIPLAVNG